MIRLLTMTLLLTAAAPALADPGAPVQDSREALALAAKVQRFYKKTHDFSADFKQVFKYQGSVRQVHSTGTVQVKKPGFMRWDYLTPDQKLLLLDGKSLYMYDLGDTQVQVQRNFSSNSLSAAVTFLWGRGELTKSFHVSKVDQPKYGQNVIELVPKKPESGFTQIYFAVNPKTGAVEKSVIFDTAGNENQFTFTNVKTNQGIPSSRFKFVKPKGVIETTIQ